MEQVKRFITPSKTRMAPGVEYRWTYPAPVRLCRFYGDARATFDPSVRRCNTIGVPERNSVRPVSRRE